MSLNLKPAFDGRRELELALSDRLPKLYRMAFRYLDNSEDAQEAVQDAFLLAFQHISQFEGRSQFSTWLNRIVINAARMKLRGRPRYKALPLDESPEEDMTPLADQIAGSGPSPEDLCEQAELHDIVSRMIERLSPKLRQAYELCGIDGLSTRDAAQVLGIQEGALKCRLVRARSGLSELFQNGGYGMRRPQAGSPEAKHLPQSRVA